MQKNIFISRIINRNNKYWDRIESRGWNIIDQSLINISPIPFNLPEQYDWIFFSSKNAVHHFFSQLTAEQYKIMQSKKFATIGPGTAEILYKWIDTIHFIGDGLFSDKQSFLKITNKKDIIIYPKAVNSRRYVQGQIGVDRIGIDVEVYLNEISNPIIPKVDIALLTSPMNAESFLKNYTFDITKVRLFSVGPATSRHFEQQRQEIALKLSKPLEEKWAKESYEYIVDNYLNTE